MVKYKHIIQAIEYNLTKSHQHLRIPKQVKLTFNRFHEETCGEEPSPNESCIVCNEKGRVVYTDTTHEREYVELDMDEIIEQYEDDWKTPQQLHLTHNHPMNLPSVCLSSGDIETFMYSYYPNDLVEFQGEQFPLRSISAESSNGGRMTLVRGDYFKAEDKDIIISLGKELWDNNSKYLHSFYKMKKNIMDKHKSEFDNTEDLSNFANRMCIEKMGKFEQSKEFKKIQKQMREHNCSLSVTYPFDYDLSKKD